MKHSLIALAAAALLATTAAVAQPGYGPGMMGGYGPGMMGGGGYGPGGYGPGMMGGYGPGMMGGGGYGPGMMGGWGAEGAWGISDLTADQRKKLGEARQDFWKKQWPLMQQMHAIGWTGADSDTYDEQAARKNYEAMAALQKQMFDNRLELRKHIDAVLTPKQRDEVRRGGRNW